ncbi:MAG: hypothetical protein GQ477_00290 [Nanohaloarchaea archaeon]|nr:hypothetical protein [Candidatus Nanohaloarchaea archaeon]
MAKYTLLLLSLLTVVLIAGCTGGKGIVDNTHEKADTSPLEVKLSLSDKPLLNTPVKLTLKVKTILNWDNSSFPTSVKIELPEGFELVSGDLEWYGILMDDEEQSIEATVKSTKTGYYRLTGHANLTLGNNPIYSTDIIYVEVTPTDAILGNRPQNDWYGPAQGQAIPTSTNAEKIKSELIISQLPELNKEFTVIYRVVPQEDILDSRYRQMIVLFPPKAFKVVAVEFPEYGKSYRHDSQLSWQGNLTVNKTVEIKATFKVINTGWGLVVGGLNIQAGDDGSKLVQDVKIVDLYVDKYFGNFTMK